MGIAVSINVGAPFHTSTVFIKNYMQNLGYEHAHISLICTIILVTMTVAFPISAYISDKIGRKPVIIASSIVLAIFTYPIFLSLHSMNYTTSILSMMLFAFIVGSYMGPIPTLFVELFPTRVRFTAVALSYNLGVAIFGGTAPMIGAALYKVTGSQISLSYYLVFLSTLCLCALLFYKETYKYNLSEDIVH